MCSYECRAGGNPRPFFVGDYPETCAKLVCERQRACSGQMMFWVKPEVHRKVAQAAELAGKSLNAWAEEVLGKAVG